ncbi:hypothetical protein Ancab_000412 [Ancistrocladus abbreviatus]
MQTILLLASGFGRLDRVQKQQCCETTSPSDVPQLSCEHRSGSNFSLLTRSETLWLYVNAKED